MRVTALPRSQVWIIGIVSSLSVAATVGIGCDSASPVRSEPVWSDRFATATPLDGPVYSLDISEAGGLVVGGSFSAAGNRRLGRVATWNGSAWDSLGPGVDSGVDAVAFGTDDEVFVGGVFANAGTLQAFSTAKWDGSFWRPLGEGLRITFPTLAKAHAIAVVDAQTVYVGGHFTQAGEEQANSIARWDGKRWHALGAGVSAAVVVDVPANNVFAVAPGLTNDIFVGGAFTRAGGSAASRIARWDGANWEALGDGVLNNVPLFEHHTVVLAVAVAGDGKVYAGGHFTEAGGALASNVAVWDGASWTALDSGLNGVVHAIAVDAEGLVFVGGEFTEASGRPANHIAVWNGATWGALGSGTNGTVWAVEVAENGDVYVGGDFTEAGGHRSVNVAVWERAS